MGMPVYEFYCSDCHRIFHFLSKRVNTEKRPGCPKCARPELERQVSVFAVSKGRQETSEDPMADVDEAKMEQAMMALAGEAGEIDDHDPRQAASLMRKLYDTTGIPLGPGMDEAIRRMEAGEDPDQIEEEMGDLLEEEDPFGGRGPKGRKSLNKRHLPPSVDDTLYEL
jgi:putative FmdB family regulatory protein